mmetsp:Transcript_40014/g.124597  ORF Transcript_40014/g.124597 Transcript_40014/m.124597 type:complete len:225 (-) Transcript_40014:105-779(-)
MVPLEDGPVKNHLDVPVRKVIEAHRDPTPLCAHALLQQQRRQTAAHEGGTSLCEQRPNGRVGNPIAECLPEHHAHRGREVVHKVGARLAARAGGVGPRLVVPHGQDHARVGANREQLPENVVVGLGDEGPQPARPHMEDQVFLPRLLLVDLRHVVDGLVGPVGPEAHHLQRQVHAVRARAAQAGHYDLQASGVVRTVHDASAPYMLDRLAVDALEIRAQEEAIQ